MPRKKDPNLVAIQIRVTQAEHRMIMQAAKADRRSLAQWGAKACVETAERELEAINNPSTPPDKTN